MKLNITDAVYCPKCDMIVTTAVCKKGRQGDGCPHYYSTTIRSDNVKELTCLYEENKKR